MTITGLSNNYYLINNSIKIRIDGFASDVDYLEIKATNSKTTKTGTIRIYPINNVFKIDISHLVKSTFVPSEYPDVTLNLNSVSIEIKTYFLNASIATETITKYFIRGGNFQGVYPDCVTQKQNYLNEGDVVSNLITDTMPTWRCDADSSLGFSSQKSPKITNGNFVLADTVNECFDVPCKGIRIIFLNKYGTYSGWYFNNYEIQDSTKHTDFIEKFSTDFNGNNFRDLGSRVTTSITVKDSVPLRFNNLIRHLIISPEVYVFDGNFNIKVILNNSKWIYNSKEKSYKHSIKFDYLEVLNPSELC